MTEFVQKHVWIFIPAYSGTIHLATMRSIIADLIVLTDKGHKVSIIDDCGNAIISDCRSLAVAKFLDSDATDLVFVDSDVSWARGALAALVDHPVDFVAGIYPFRRDPIDFPTQWDNTKSEIWSCPETGLIEVHGVPAGFMKVTRTALEKMVEHYKDTQTFFCKEAPNQRAVGLFDPYFIGGLKFGEDYSFCKRWRDIGGKIWIDPYIRMGHCGYKTFFGSIAEWLKERMEKDKEVNPEQQLQDLMKEIVESSAA